MRRNIVASFCAIALLVSGSSSGIAAQAAKKPVSLSKKSMTLKAGKKKTLKVKKAAGVKIKSKTFTSSNKKVASVTKKTGTVKAKKAGKATIKVKVRYQQKFGWRWRQKIATLKCKVKVTKSQKTPAKATRAPSGGSQMGDSNSGGGTPGANQNPQTGGTTSTPQPSAEVPTLPVYIPKNPGLYDTAGNRKKSWEQLVADGDVDISENGCLDKINKSLAGVLVISEIVTDIWDDAVFKESKLTGLGIPGSVVHLGEYTAIFGDCTNLVSVRLGKGMETIGSHTFYECTNLLNVELPDSLKTIEYEAFYGCSKLKEINLPVGLKEIGGSAFEGTAWLKKKQEENDFVVVNHILIRNGRLDHGEITLPEGIECIGESAFSGCKDLDGVIVSDGVQKIEDYAFEKCENLSKVELPESVQEVGLYVFEDTSWLETNGKREFAVANHVLIRCGPQISGTVRLPDEITVIAGGAFASCAENITSVELPENLTYIGDYAFTGCSNLAQIDFPAGIKKIGRYAFCACSKLVPELPESSCFIGESAFSYCDAIVSVTIPADVILGDYVFSGCPNLSEVTIEDGRRELSAGLFASCKNLKNVSLPTSITSIGVAAFDNSGLTSIDLPNSLEKIDSYAFYECENLLELRVPDQVSYIGTSAFYGIPLVLYSGTAKGSPWGAQWVERNGSTTPAPTAPETFEPTVSASDMVINLSDLMVLPKIADDDKTTKVYSTMNKYKKENGVLDLIFTQAGSDMYVLDLGRAYDLSGYQGLSLTGVATEQLALGLYPDTADFREDEYRTRQVAFATYPFFEGSHAHRSYEGTSYGDTGVEETFICNWYDGTDSEGVKVEGTKSASSLANVRYIVLRVNNFNATLPSHEYKLKTLTFRKDWYENKNPTDKEIDAMGGDSHKGIWFE